MSRTTFSGPLLAGTQRDGVPAQTSGNIIGPLNLGRPVLTQVYTATSSAMTSAGAARTAFILPAGSKIVDLELEETVAIATAADLAIQVGVSGTAGRYYASFSTGVLVGKVPQATIDAVQQVLNTNNIGVTDISVLLTFTAATANATAGTVVITIYYIQRNADGS